MYQKRRKVHSMKLHGGENDGNWWWSRCWEKPETDNFWWIEMKAWEAKKCKRCVDFLSLKVLHMYFVWMYIQILQENNDTKRKAAKFEREMRLGCWWFSMHGHEQPSLRQTRSQGKCRRRTHWLQTLTGSVSFSFSLPLSFVCVSHLFNVENRIAHLYAKDVMCSKSQISRIPSRFQITVRQFWVLFYSCF